MLSSSNVALTDRIGRLLIVTDDITIKTDILSIKTPSLTRPPVLYRIIGIALPFCKPLSPLTLPMYA